MDEALISAFRTQNHCHQGAHQDASNCHLYYNPFLFILSQDLLSNPIEIALLFSIGLPYLPLQHHIRSQLIQFINSCFAIPSYIPLLTIHFQSSFKMAIPTIKPNNKLYVTRLHGPFGI
jgi:hypothetical protein